MQPRPDPRRRLIIAHRNTPPAVSTLEPARHRATKAEFLAMGSLTVWVSASRNRQSESYAREGIELDVSTLADWVGA